MNIKFSACPYNKTIGKNYYKNFAPMSITSLQELSELMYTHSLSSYLYGKEKTSTSSGEMVEYRKATRNVIGKGNVIFIDIDNKIKIEDGVDENGKPKYKQVKAINDEYVSLARLTSSLKRINALAVITESRSSKYEWSKFHVAVVVNDTGELEQFTKRYLGFIEKLKINAKGLDLIMKVPTQNMAPAFENKERPITVLEGQPLDFISLQPSIEFITELGESNDKTFGVHKDLKKDFDALIIKRENHGDDIEKFEIKSLLDEAKKNGSKDGKIRTQCHHGYAHDNRYDSGFLRFHQGVSIIKSHCSVCNDSVVVWEENITDMFEDLGELPEEDKPRIYENEPITLDMLFDIGVAINYEASNLEPLDERKLIFDKGLHLFYAPSGYFKSYTVASLVKHIDKDKFYFDFEHNPSGLKEHCESLNINYITPPNDLKELKKLLTTKADCSSALFIFDSFAHLIAEGNNDATETTNIVKLLRKLIVEMKATIIFIDHATKLDYKESYGSPKDFNFKLEGNESGKKKPCDLMYKVQPIDFESPSMGVKLLVDKSRTTHRYNREIILIAEDDKKDMFDEKL